MKGIGSDPSGGTSVEGGGAERSAFILPVRPAVSVIIPAYGAARYIGEALDSVLAQTRTDFEIVVVNDGCPETEELEEALAPYRERVVYRIRENGGPGAARNTGIRAASAPLVAFLDADDLWEPNFLEEQLAFLYAHPEIDLVYADAIIFQDEAGPMGTFMARAPSVGEPTFEALLSLRCTVNTSSVVVRRESAVRAGLFDEQIGNYSEDFDFYLRLARSGARLGYQRKALIRHREHPESLTAIPMKLSAGALRVLRKVRRFPDLEERERAILEETERLIAAWRNLDFGKADLARGNYARAYERLSQANRILKSRKLSLILFSLRWAPGLVRLLHSMRERSAARSSKRRSAPAAG